MNKLALILAFLLGSIASALAACTSPAVMHDFPGTAFNMSLATNAGDGNCASNMAIIGTLPAFAAIPAFKFDQTTPGTTNGVQINAALPAGTNLLGKVGIDQTTPGTTNGVQVNSSALPTGASTSANQTNKTQFTQLTDGTNAAATYTGYGTAPTGNVPGVNAFVTNATPGIANNADGIAAVAAGSTSPVPVNNYNYVFNGATWDRLRSIAGGSLQTVNGGNTYNTVAASQSAQALTGGSGGATGDYLSHCMVFPTSTSPGVVTILDNASTIFPFPGGASSLSNLVPFPIAIGAKSTSGAWKVTTGANVSVTCVGKFT